MQRQTKESLLLLPCRRRHRRHHEMSTSLLVSSPQENITLSDWRQTVRGDLERKKERERERTDGKSRSIRHDSRYVTRCFFFVLWWSGGGLKRPRALQVIRKYQHTEMVLRPVQPCRFDSFIWNYFFSFLFFLSRGSGQRGGRSGDEPWSKSKVNNKRPPQV